MIVVQPWSCPAVMPRNAALLDVITAVQALLQATSLSNGEWISETPNN